MVSNAFPGHLLSSNECPSAMDAVHVRIALTELDSELTALDAEIQSLEAKLLLVRQRRETCSQKKDSMAAVISPLRLLPPELISEIMFHALADSRYPRLDDILTLGHICRRWRQVLYATPRLWESISIDVHPTLPTAEVKSWLGHSKARPLSLSLQGDITEGILDTFCIHSDRVEELDITVGDTTEIQVIDYLFPDSDRVWTQLKRLHLWLGDSLSQLVLRSTPNLTSVSLLGHDVDIAENAAGPEINRTIGLPYLQLIRLCLELFLTPEEHYMILRECLNLVECSIYSTGGFVTPPLVYIQLRHLVSLTVLFDNEPRGAIDFLVLPSLERLEIQGRAAIPHAGTVRDLWIFEGTVISLLARSQCLIKKFTLGYIAMSELGLVQCFLRMPKLRELCVKTQQGASLSDAVLGGMVYRPPMVPLLPELESLTICGNISQFSMNALSDFASSRQWDITNSTPHPVVRLGQLHVVRNPINRDMLLRLCKLKKDGLDLEYDSPGFLEPYEEDLDAYEELFMASNPYLVSRRWW